MHQTIFFCLSLSLYCRAGGPSSPARPPAAHNIFRNMQISIINNKIHTDRWANCTGRSCNVMCRTTCNYNYKRNTHTHTHMATWSTAQRIGPPKFRWTIFAGCEMATILHYFPAAGFYCRVNACVSCNFRNYLSKLLEYNVLCWAVLCGANWNNNYNWKGRMWKR